MASVFNYQTGKCDFDFHLKKCDTACNRDFLPRTKVGNKYCKICKHYKGEVEDFVCCSFYDKDDEGASSVWRVLRESLKREALNALCY